MAIITTSFEPMPEYFPYSGLPDVFIATSAVAKGEVRFKIADENIDVPGAGNNQGAVITCNLPGDYGYVLTDLMLNLNNNTIGGTADWPDNLLCWFQDDQGQNQNRTFEWYVDLSSSGTALSVTDRPYKAYTPKNIPSMVITGSPVLTIQALNPTANDVLQKVNFYARFIQYTVEQQHHAGVNTPVPVRGV